MTPGRISTAVETASSSSRIGAHRKTAAQVRLPERRALLPLSCNRAFRCRAVPVKCFTILPDGTLSERVDANRAGVLCSCKQPFCTPRVVSSPQFHSYPGNRAIIRAPTLGAGGGLLGGV